MFPIFVPLEKTRLSEVNVTLALREGSSESLYPGGLLAPTGALKVTMCYYISTHFFQIFTQSIDAIDVTSVTPSRLNSINAIDVTRC